MKKKNDHTEIIYGILLTVPAFLLLLEEYMLVGKLCVQGSDARVYISIAENFVNNGHFIQTARPYIGMVVPPGTPFMIALFRLLGISNYGIMAIQILMFGVSNVLLYETERRITGRGFWAPVIYTVACMRCYLRLGMVMVEHYYLLLLCLAVWVMYRDLQIQKKLVIMNVIGLALLLTRPVLAPVYFSVLIYTIIWCWQNSNYKIGAGMILLPIFILSINVAVNYKETGEYILLENYSGYDLYIASRPDAPITIEEASLYIVDEPDVLRIRDDGTLTATEQNDLFKNLAKQNRRNYLGIWIRNSISRGYELFVKKYFFATLYTLCGGIMLAVQEQKQKNYRATIMLILTLVLAALTSFGIVELRYTLVIWPMASIHGAYITDVILRHISTKTHRNKSKAFI